MATIHTAWKKTDGPVRYHGGQTEVQLGDEVEIRGLFRKRRCQVERRAPQLFAGALVGSHCPHVANVKVVSSNLITRFF